MPAELLTSNEDYDTQVRARLNKSILRIDELGVLYDISLRTSGFKDRHGMDERSRLSLLRSEEVLALIDTRDIPEISIATKLFITYGDDEEIGKYSHHRFRIDISQNGNFLHTVHSNLGSLSSVQRFGNDSRNVLKFLNPDFVSNETPQGYSVRVFGEITKIEIEKQDAREKDDTDAIENFKQVRKKMVEKILKKRVGWEQLRDVIKVNLTSYDGGKYIVFEFLNKVPRIKTTGWKPHLEDLVISAGGYDSIHEEYL